MKRIAVGFIPLADAAPLIAAHELGFAAEAGLALDLTREVSWANIRDKLSVGLFDAAHMLAPMALASALGIGHVRVPLAVAMALGLNGSAVTISTAFAHEIGEELAAAPAEPKAALPLIAAALKRRESAGLAPPAFGIVFPFSTHNYLLRAYLAAGGIDPERDVQLVVIPPSLMVGSLEKGLIDGFCVGSPWNAVAVERGGGHILAAGAALFSALPDKVLALSEGFAAAEPEAARALVAATLKAAAWCADPAHAGALADMLCAPAYLDVPAPLLRRAFEGRLAFSPGGGPAAVPGFLRFDAEALRPSAGRFAWLYAQMVRWGQARIDPAALDAIARLAAGDLFAGAAGAEAAPPAGDPVGSLIEPAFDPADLPGFLARFDARGMAHLGA